MNNVNITYLSWKDIDEYSKKLAIFIQKSDFMPSIIVGIHRGGCIIAVILSHILNIELMCSIGIRTTQSNDVHAQRMKPALYDSFSLQLTSGKKVLLIDDIIDTGETLIKAKNVLLSYGCKELKSAALICSPMSKHIVDFYGKEIKPWVVFPWETQIKE